MLKSAIFKQIMRISSTTGLFTFGNPQASWY